MSRSGYTDEWDESTAMWRGVVASASRGRRGQAFFRELVTALDAMPAKRLVANDLETAEGEVCALGALGRSRGVDLAPLDEALDEDSGDYSKLGAAFNIAEQLAQETMFINDEAGPRRGETPEERWARVRKWAAEQIDVREDELLPEARP